jgi:hypothetical protein
VSRDSDEVVRATWEACERRDMDALFAFYDPEIVWDQTRYGERNLRTSIADTMASSSYSGSGLSHSRAITHTRRSSLTPGRLSSCAAAKAVAESKAA